MSRIVDTGEPVSVGRRDLRAVERKAFQDALFAAGLFTFVVLVNGILAILAIGFLQAVGLWGVEPEMTDDAISGVSRSLRAMRSPPAE
jgi:hypothetical protein